MSDAHGPNFDPGACEFGKWVLLGGKLKEWVWVPDAYCGLPKKALTWLFLDHASPNGILRWMGVKYSNEQEACQWLREISALRRTGKRKDIQLARLFLHDFIAWKYRDVPREAHANLRKLINA